MKAFLEAFQHSTEFATNLITRATGLHPNAAKPLFKRMSALIDLTNDLESHLNRKKWPRTWEDNTDKTLFLD